MTRTRPSPRVAGWLLACACSFALIGGAAESALAAERQAPVVFLDLATLPPAAPSIAAVAEAAPEVAATPPPAPEVPDAAEADPSVVFPVPAKTSLIIPNKAPVASLREFACKPLITRAESWTKLR
jgi:hypothetical protein